MLRLAQKKVLITGASRGIGFEIAKRLAQEGADLFLTARSMDDLKKVQANLSQYKTKVEIGAADVSDQDSVQSMVESANAALGRIDILVNNAGITIVKPFLEYELADLDRIMKINVYGVFFTCQAVLKGMKKQGQGKIINIASTAGKWGSINQSAYNASKHAVVGLTRCLALEFGPFNINVNAICPGFTETDLASEFIRDKAEIDNITEDQARDKILKNIPLNRFVKTEEIASMAAYLASSEADSITGQSLSVCGGKLMI